MSRPLLLVFLLIALIVTWQVEWKQPRVVVERDAVLSVAEKQLRIAERQESVKEKIILSQEKSIHDLRNTVRDLQEQLKRCQNMQETTNTTRPYHSVDNNVIEIERADKPFPTSTLADVPL